ncbi:MAG: sensor domain-containing diguanylate cyclase [Treponema sp.]|nr:sensor domain-containing diguanylate cyclase [Treponema sp.]
MNATFNSDNETLSNYEKQVYDLQQLLEISRSLCTTLELNKLIQSIIYISMAQMRVMGAGIFIQESLESPEYSLAENFSGLEVSQSVNYKINIDSEFSDKLSRVGKVYTAEVFKEEFSDFPEYEMLASLKPSLIVPLILKNHINGILILGERIALTEEDASYTDYELNEIYTIGSLASIAVNNASLVEQSSTDMMTKLKLKYYFFNILTDKIDASFTANRPLCVLMFDIDHFKKFNDTFGHACGDYVLQTVAKIIKSTIRSEDMASRYGGEEFTVMLPDTSREEAIQVAERIRQSIQDYDFFYQDQHMKVTISCGISECNLEENPVPSAKVLVDQADMALYVSKHRGRNRVTFADKSIRENEKYSVQE